MKFILAMFASLVILIAVVIIVAMAVIDVVIDFDEYEREEFYDEF
jgi:hypothetical protein